MKTENEDTNLNETSILESWEFEEEKNVDNHDDSDIVNLTNPENQESNNLTKDNNHSEKKSLDSGSNGKKKKKFGFPSSMLIVFSLLFIFIILTWIVPHAPLVQQSVEHPLDYDVPSNDLIFNILDTNGDHEISHFGILDSGFMIILGFYQALGIILYLFALGAILEILIKTETFERTIGSSLNGLKNKELILIPILFTMFSLFGSIWGMQEESLPYYSVMIPFMILSGFTPLTTVLVMMIGNTTGMMASITNPFSVGVALSASNQSIPQNVEIGIGAGIAIRTVIWIFVTAIGATFVTVYSLKHSKKTSEEFDQEIKKYETRINQEINLEQFEVKTLKMKHRLSLLAFTITIIILIVGLIPWSTDPNNNGFGTDVVSSLWPPIGHWSFAEMTSLIFFGILAQILIHGPRKYNWVEILTTGAKGMLTVSIVIAIARGASITLFYSGLSNALVNALTSNIVGEDVSVYFFILSVFFISFIIGLLIPSTSGSATLLFPILSAVIFEKFPDTQQGADVLVYSIIAFSLALGITNMITPAQPVLLASIDYTGLNYKDYMQAIWIYILIQIIVVIGVILPIVSLL